MPKSRGIDSSASASGEECIAHGCGETGFAGPLTSPPGGSAKRCGGSPCYAYFSRMRVERSTSRKASPSLSDSVTASITEQAIMR